MLAFPSSGTASKTLLEFAMDFLEVWAGLLEGSTARCSLTVSVFEAVEFLFPSQPTAGVSGVPGSSAPPSCGAYKLSAFMGVL